MNGFLQLAKKRYSCRKYQPVPVEEEKINYLLECGRIAPSAANRQPWKVFVVRDSGILSLIHDAYPREWFAGAPVVFVFCGDHSLSWKRQKDAKDHADIDIAIMVDHITLAATEQGLATCWICAFDPDKLRQILELPDHLEPLVVLPLGYPADSADENRHQQSRKPANDFVTFL